jgi:hypothetical protein
MAPAEEAARFEFPAEMPQQGLRRMDANMAAAIQLALEDFRPRDATPPPGSRPEEACLYRRESYDVAAAPGPEGVMLVRFDVDDEACPPAVPPGVVEGVKVLPPAEVTFYAVDIRTMRILSVGTYARQRIVE